jgi:hypothetical protein
VLNADVQVSCEIYWIFAYEELQELRKEFLFFLAWSWSVLFGQTCFWSSFNSWNIKCAAFGLVFKYSVKMQQYVLYYRPRMLQILSTVSHLFSWVTWHAFYAFTSLNLWCVTTKFKTLNSNSATFERQIPINRLCSTDGVITKGCLRNFIILRIFLFKVKTKFYASSLFLKEFHFTGLQQ